MPTSATQPGAAFVTDAEAFDLDALYRAHAETVARWAARLGGPLLDVDDAVQEVFLVAQRRRPTDEGNARMTTWLYRVTENVVRHRRRKDRLRRWLVGSAQDVALRVTASAPTPLEDLESRRAAAAIYRVLDELPDKPRTALVLFELEGLSGEQIAALTGARLATVWVWLHRARARFLDRLAELEPAGEDRR